MRFKCTTAYLDSIIAATRGRKRQEKSLRVEGYPVLRAIGKANTFPKSQIKPVLSNQSISVGFNDWERVPHEIFNCTIIKTVKSNLGELQNVKKAFR